MNAINQKETQTKLTRSLLDLIILHWKGKACMAINCSPASAKTVASTSDPAQSTPCLDY